jgi:Transposase DDE domain group 1
VKLAKADIYRQVNSLPALKFEEQQLTSFAGLVVFQKLFETCQLRARLQEACAHLPPRHHYGFSTILQCLIVHLLLGYRQLRESAFYRDDPLVKRVLGLKVLPSVPTVSRMLSEFDPPSVAAQQTVSRDLALERLQKQAFRTVTLDFDGSVQSTTRHAEGTAVGFNKQKKGARSYYPLFCTIAQTGQVLDVLHRSGNVHDSHGAIEFVSACVQAVRRRLGASVRLEARLDSAFFSDAMVRCLESLGLEYTISVPFERFVPLKERIEKRKVWWRVPGSAGKSHAFEQRWKPQSWAKKARFIFIRNTVAVQNKEPLQLSLFEPVEQGYEFKVIVTNKTATAGKVAHFHEGRGYQEKLYGELKGQAQMGYVPARRWVANPVYLLCSVLAHNLCRELQMQVEAPVRGTTEKRTVRWLFEELDTLRRTLIARAGRLTRPQGKLTLTLNANPTVQNALLRFLQA